MLSLSTAYAATKKLTPAEAEMKNACVSDAVYGAEAKKQKTIGELAKWVEKMEYGKDAAFKKTVCFEAHEKWETAAGKNEESEENEHKN